MIKEKIRSPEEMPLETKFNYCKILALMVTLDAEIDPLKMAEFYRLISRLKVDTKTRTRIVNSILEKDTEIEILCQSLNHGLKEQEKNILRFSLIKDLIIIMRANHYVTAEEKELMDQIKRQLDIRDEQIQFFEGEYYEDKMLFKENLEGNIVSHIIQDTVAHVAAVGVPLTAIHFSGNFKGLGALGMISGLRALGGKKLTGKFSIIMGMGTAVLMGIITYKSIGWLMNRSTKKQMNFKKFIQQEMVRLHERAIQYIEEDQLILEEKVEAAKMDEVNNKIEELMRMKKLMEKTLAVFKNTDPKMV